ncbi:MAG: hypothetical protein JEZ08_25480 [Clostridiales bacterium]|nr:hypothetical protein [Clostridiales bacterium]
MRTLVLTIFILSSCFSGFSQAQKLISSDTYDAGALYGYMNGGSELYHEYGFQELIVKEVEVDNINLTLEYYRMKDMLSAYGIYSVNVHKCHSSTHDSGIHKCHNPYQLQAVVGNYYLSFINSTGSQRAQDASLTLLHEFVNKQDSIKSFTIPSAITNYNSSPAIYLCGRLGIENRASQWLSYFNLFQMEECWLLKWPNMKANMLVVDLKKMNPQIKFSNFTVIEDKKYIVQGKIATDHFLIMRMLRGDQLVQDIFNQMK